MKKFVLLGMLMVSLLGMFAACGGPADIGKDKATQIALEDAKLAETDVSRFYVAKVRDNGQDTYEVKFTNENTEYEYEILAADGKIIKVDYDRVQEKNDNGENSPLQKPEKPIQENNNSSANNQISREDATKLALERVPGATAKDLKIELDYDDGKYKYEGDIIYDGKEYEFEIDAVTGDFLEWSEEKR